MAAVRAAWWILAGLAAVFTVWEAGQPVGTVSLSCAKSGTLYESGVRSGATCDDSMIDALGVWPLIQLGVLLAVAPVVAAVCIRVWVSWLACAALAVLAGFGLGHWAGFWILLLLAGAPMTVVALVISAAHLGVQVRRNSRQPDTAPVS
ncbi:hypothetical protein AAFP30_14860 [Gordonia sp. CPCC 205515]|uniref:hypothetical protein n=1 Tax=Gordonia sp. CPCC 205515 TaxID=3140791 RepID=UPI003AF3C02D